ncbi:TonB-linked SusC/RagA family outer membrane protein [Sphingobacterium allocomposti]|uniref:TonB-linked SusC/RagA family outer membrane protein n=1 Tax=Sphingobacterium allocomposti TaxID=415956 RepID=A0A5S5DKH8_9SPHI|nr:SusC/RagA family TonB-linked outer membrane protein [Sphingobacterium composti Yoo et al. 2007 non Ten et al. 2007]TYP95868.1 TonB-linked SusC/RagA family outer membrane protein [Sphingobacterium composti Yoo et al. 2007 non Ten et al. 2007]
MKSRAELPLAFLRGTRNVLLACLLVTPFVGVEAAGMPARELRKIEKFVNITGKVIDQDGNPVMGATVLVKGTKSGVQTDKDGMFRINLPEGNTRLVVSFVGYKVQEVNVAGMTSITITLESSDAIDEVVVTGYGTQKRSEIVGSVATITGEELMDIPAPNIAGALRNQIAGVGVSEASGRPGSRISLNIRGASTSQEASRIGSTSDPLYIVDGITVSSDVFDALDPSMVENITFLKDASAAIYGAAGAKGVVLVTTKRGKQGKPSISYNGYLGITDAARKPDFLSGYELAQFLNESAFMGNKPESEMFSQADLDYLRGLDVDSWYDQLWKPAIMQRHNLSISGGSERTTFFVGGSFQNQNANYAGMKDDKYSLRSGLTTTIVEGLKADIAFNLNHNIRKSQNQIGNETDADFFERIISTPDWVPMYIDGLPVNINGRDSNPLAVFNSGYAQSRKSQDYNINASLTYSPSFLKGFSAKVQVSQRGGNGSSEQYIAPYILWNFERMGNNNLFFSNSLVAGDNPFTEVLPLASASLTSSLANNGGYQGFVTLDYSGTFADHSIAVVAGAEQTVSNSEDMGLRWLNQLIPESMDYWGFDQNLMERTTRAILKTTKRSAFGRLSYDYKKKYILQVVARLDASSNFARGDRWGWSPSVGAGWIVSQENFFKDNISFVNHLKLKVNWGITGDDRVSERLWQERYVLDVNNGYMFGDNNYGVGMNPQSYPNLNITWEKMRSFNFGMESTLWNNKLNIGMDFYQNKIFDGFDRGANETNPLYSGLIAPVVNYREAYSWGSEFTIGYNTKIAEDWSINAGMNFGWGNSIVTKMLYNQNNLIETDRSSGNWLGTSFGVDPRKYVNSNIGFRTQGMFRTQEQVDAFLAENPNYTINGNVPQVGWMIYEDTNGDGVVNFNDNVVLFDRISPRFSTGINLGIGYKNFSLRTNIMARFGGKVFVDSRARSKPDPGTNVPIFWRDRWTPEDPMNGKYPRADDPLINDNADIWALNGTTIRVNNMTLSYSIPSNVARRIGLGSGRILLTGNNLWTLVNPFSYKDPYSPQVYNYPTVRTISVGLSASL